jgi:hypothetical protein
MPVDELTRQKNNIACVSAGLSGDMLLAIFYFRY